MTQIWVVFLRLFVSVLVSQGRELCSAKNKHFLPKQRVSQGAADWGEGRSLTVVLVPPHVTLPFSASKARLPAGHHPEVGGVREEYMRPLGRPGVEEGKQQREELPLLLLSPPLSPPSPPPPPPPPSSSHCRQYGFSRCVRLEPERMDLLPLRAAQLRRFNYRTEKLGKPYIGFPSSPSTEEVFCTVSLYYRVWRGYFNLGQSSNSSSQPRQYNTHVLPPLRGDRDGEMRS